ncbi:Cytochrome P450 12a5 [Carabus blaptoides fortunei]
MLRAKQISRVFREHASSAAAQQTIQKPTELGDCPGKIENGSNEWTNAKPFDSIPGPKPGLVLGYYSHFLPKLGKYYGMEQVQVHISLNKEYGNIVRLRGLKTRKDIICCYDPKDIETILRTEGPWPMRDVLHSIKYYRTQHRSELFQGYVGLFASDGEVWHKARSVLNSILMQPSVVSHYIPQMNSVGEDFIHRMRHLAAMDPNGEMPETFQNEIAKWAIESVGVIALDCRFGMLDRNISSISEIQHAINDICLLFSLFYKIDVVPNLSLLVSTPMWRKHMNTMDRICTFVQKELNKTMTRIRKEGNNDTSIVEKLLNIDPKTVFVNAMDVIIGGTDTTSRTMGNLLYLLAKHPDVQEKLREEVRRVVPTKQTAVTKEKLNNLPYLRAVIKESMRHTPIILSLVRKVSKDLVLSGYQIPKGTDIMLEQIPLAWNEKYFTDPKQFKPERWMRSTESNGLKPNAWVFLPFGFGPRSCVGRRLASLELETLLAKVVRNFKLEWPHGEIQYKYELVYGIDSPLKIRVTEVEE